jgi:hypothetical protein
VQAVISSVITRAVAAELPVGVDATSGAQANRYAEQDATTLVTDPADGRAGAAIAERKPAARPVVPPPLHRAAPIGPSLVAALALPRVMKGRVAQALDSCPSARIVGGSPRARKRSAGAADDAGKALRTDRPEGGVAPRYVTGGPERCPWGPQTEHLLPTRHLTCRRQWLPASHTRSRRAPPPTTKKTAFSCRRPSARAAVGLDDLHLKAVSTPPRASRGDV